MPSISLIEPFRGVILIPGFDELIASATFSSKGSRPVVSISSALEALRSCAIDGSNVSGSADAGARHSTVTLSPPILSTKYFSGGMVTTTRGSSSLLAGSACFPLPEHPLASMAARKAMVGHWGILAVIDCRLSCGES